MDSPTSQSNSDSTADPVASNHSKAELIEWIARVILACLAIAALALAALEGHEAIGTAFVGAAIAFGLAAAFFDRVLEVSTTGVKLADLRALREAAEREVPGATPDEKEDLIEEGKEILVSKRSAGEPITPALALREASVSWLRNGLAAEIHFANWLVQHGWTIAPERAKGGAEPDLIASRKGQRVAVEIKTGRRPLGLNVVHQVRAMAHSVETCEPSPGQSRSILPVLVLGEIGLTPDAAAYAAHEGFSVYRLEADDQIVHLSGPTLD